MKLETTIAGIPCQVEVTHYRHQPPMGPSADSDWDCYGYTELDFDVFDRKGYSAPWLEAKLTDYERELIEEQLIDAMKN